MTLPLPERIGRFRVVGLLGQGAMGIVYRGRDDALERDVALKVMAAAALGDADNRERFLREARASARLQHPNIVTIYELGEHEGQPFMALELLEGLDLQRALELGIRPDPKLILPVVLQMLAGLGHAHAHGVVHRDVKPSNVFIPQRRPVKIMDFGVARLAATTLTGTGVVLGTPSYMSPEQVRGGEVDGRSDLFSAGLILYELLTGEKAFRAGSVVAVLYRIAHEPPDLALLPKGRDWAPLRAVIERVLARDADARFADAAAMSRDLLHALVALGGTPVWSQAPDLSLLTHRTPRGRASPAQTWSAAATESLTNGGWVDLPLAPAAEQPATLATAPPLPTLDSAPTMVDGAVRERPAWRSPAALVVTGAAVALLVVLVLFSGRRREAGVAVPPAQDEVVSTPSARPATSPPQHATPAPAATLAPPAPPPARATPAPAVAPPSTTLVRPTPPVTPPPHAAVKPEEAQTAPDATPLAARLERAERLLEQGHYASASSEATAVLERAPDNEQARDIIQEAEALLLVESSLKNARAAWQRGDREATRSELQKGLAVRPNDARLLALWRQIAR